MCLDSLPKISVIIPVYNDEFRISICLDSVLHNQSLDHVEVICVNDGSTDNSLQILELYRTTHANLRIITQTNKGLSSARNTGLEAATGKYVYFVDSDDKIANDMLRKLWLTCEEKALDVLFFSFADFGDTPGICEKFKAHISRVKRVAQLDTNVLSGQDMFIKMCKDDEYYVVVWAQILRRQFLLEKSITFRDGILFEDNLFTFSILMNAERAYCINDVLYFK